jgi:pimeloyl-ACP methyl ester carboxylesterase
MMGLRLACALFVVIAIAAPAPAQGDSRIVVFVVNGAGGGSACSDNFRDVTAQDRCPLVIQEVRWCPYQNVCLDHRDQGAQFAAAARLADGVVQLRRQCPTVRIVFVGYSTGSRVVLAAAEMLPPNSVDRVVVIASSVSNCYDLRPALRASMGGIDAYYSAEDPILANAEQTLGTADGLKVPMAGRTGFVYPCDPRECGAYANLRQCRWRPNMGGQGGHAVWIRPLFLRRSVVPVILSPPCSIVK